MKQINCLIQLVFIFLALFTINLFAQLQDVEGWSNAKWGMTEDDLLKAFEGQIIKLAIPNQYQNSYSNLEIPHVEINRDQYKVSFLMDNQTKRLTQVNITPLDKSALIVTFRSLEESLILKYGQPTYKNDENTRYVESHKRTWNFPTTVITLMYFDARVGTNLFALVYDPAKKEENL